MNLLERAANLIESDDNITLDAVRDLFIENGFKVDKEYKGYSFRVIKNYPEYPNQCLYVSVFADTKRNIRGNIYTYSDAIYNCLKQYREFDGNFYIKKLSDAERIISRLNNGMEKAKDGIIAYNEDLKLRRDKYYNSLPAAERFAANNTKFEFTAKCGEVTETGETSITAYNRAIRKYLKLHPNTVKRPQVTITGKVIGNKW